MPEFKIYHSGFLIAPYAPAVWKEETRAYLIERKPRFIVLQNDAMSHISGTEMTSAEAVRSLPGIDSLLRGDYDTVMADGMTVVFERVEKYEEGGGPP